MNCQMVSHSESQVQGGMRLVRYNGSGKVIVSLADHLVVNALGISMSTWSGTDEVRELFRRQIQYPVAE